MCNIFRVISHSEIAILQGCTRDKKKRFSRDNGMDPGAVPPQLQGLTQVEEMLISAVMPMMCLYRLPLGQYGYSGHVVNLPQDISTFVTNLPRLPSDIDVILVCKEGVSDSHRDFRVRRSKNEAPLVQNPLRCSLIA